MIIFIDRIHRNTCCYTVIQIWS